MKRPELTNLSTKACRLLAEDFARQYPLAIVPFPAKIKPHRYRLVWHERTHKNQAMRWLRGELTAAARELAHRPTT